MNFNPWLDIGLRSYEEHMSSPEVFQLQVLNEIVKEQLSYNKKKVAILGVAGGNGLEHFDENHYDTIILVDINKDYLDVCLSRYQSLRDIINPICVDLSLPLPPVIPDSDLLICNLIVEYIGVKKISAFIKKNIKNNQIVSLVIQKNLGSSFVSGSPHSDELKKLELIYNPVDEELLKREFNILDLQLILEKDYPVKNNKLLRRMDFLSIF